MKVEKPITVRMRDGVRISLCVYRPDADGRFPALFAASPYQYEMDDVPAYPLFLWRETGPVEWYVSQGYAYVHADVRGSGQSEGEFEFMGLNEQEDYLELIAWIVAQPWCNGRVGGIGQSYYAMAQWLMATYNPPGLACIAPYDGLVDQYRGSNYHGGIYCSYRSVWYTSLRADNQHRLAGKHGRPPMKFDLVGEIIDHPLDDEFWRQRSPYWRLDRIKCPVLSVGHWGKMGLHLRGNILGYEEVKAPKKLVVTGARNTFEAHRMFDQVEFHEKELLPFYDLHLKGANNGFMDADPVKAVRARRQCLAHPGNLAAARDQCRLLSAQGSVGQRHLAQRRRAVGRKARGRRSADQLHLSGLGMGQRRRGDRPGRPGRSGAAGADFHQRAARQRSRSHRADRAETLCVIDRDRYPVHRQADRPASAKSRKRAPRASSRLLRRCRRAG